jgi:hypothetical protein
MQSRGLQTRKVTCRIKWRNTCVAEKQVTLLMWQCQRERKLRSEFFTLATATAPARRRTTATERTDVMYYCAWSPRERSVASAWAILFISVAFSASSRSDRGHCGGLHGSRCTAANLLTCARDFLFHALAPPLGDSDVIQQLPALHLPCLCSRRGRRRSRHRCFERRVDGTLELLSAQLQPGHLAIDLFVLCWP